jgi:uncharacterized protein
LVEAILRSLLLKMTSEHTIALSMAIMIIGFLYSSVGHAGASGYIAVMLLFGLAPSVVKPMALLLNIMVATITTWQFYRAGHFSWALFWPFAALAIPFAFLGGFVNLPAHAFKVLAGVILLYSAYRFLAHPADDAVASSPSRPVALCVGAGIGLLSGLTGTGGGIFLTPVLLLKRWARAKTAAAVSALFILVNSISGLAGNLIRAEHHFPSLGPLLAVAAVCGGSLGSYFGSRRFNPAVIKRLLAVVLLIAGIKLILAK